MAVTPLSPLTRTGVLLGVVLLLPNWPYSFDPQAQTVPSDFSARLSSSPAVMAVTPVSPLTCTGVLRMVSRLMRRMGQVLMPNWPKLLRPQAHTVPSDFRARL